MSKYKYVNLNIRELKSLIGSKNFVCTSVSIDSPRISNQCDGTNYILLDTVSIQMKGNKLYLNGEVVCGGVKLKTKNVFNLDTTTVNIQYMDYGDCGSIRIDYKIVSNSNFSLNIENNTAISVNEEISESIFINYNYFKGPSNLL